MAYQRVYIEFTVSDFYGTVRLWTFSEQERSIVRAERKEDAFGPVFEVYRNAEHGRFTELRHYRPLEMRVHDPEVRRLELPLVDCPESRLEGVHPADVLIDIYRHIPEEYRPDNERDPRELFNVGATTPLAELQKQTRKADRISEVLKRKYPEGSEVLMERLKREQPLE